MKPRTIIPALLVCCGLATLVLGGCTAALQGYPETIPDDISVAESNYYVSAQSILDYRNTPSQKLRDNIIDARMLVIDRNFQEFEKSLYQEGLKLGLGVDWLVLALSGATATIGGETLKAALGAVSAGVVGAKSSFDKRAFMEKSLAGILAQMKAQRAVVELSIRTQQQSGIDDYRLHQALSDVAKYYNAGALPTALNGIIQEASVTAEKAQADLKTVLTAKYTTGPLRDRINRWLDSDVGTNVPILENWLGSQVPPINTLAGIWVNDENTSTDALRDAIRSLNIPE